MNLFQKWQLLPLLLLTLVPHPCRSGGRNPGMKPETIRLSIREIRKDGSLAVALRNASSRNIRLWDNGNSWGWSNWRVVVIRGSASYLVIRDPDAEFTRNFPGHHDLPPAGETTEILALNDGSWRQGNSAKISLERGDELIVLYTVPETAESRKESVWTGSVSATGKYD